jgi:hypothetical protein
MGPVALALTVPAATATVITSDGAGALLSTFRGSSAHDDVVSGGAIALSNGSANSLVSSTTGDQVGLGGARGNL